jgi:hypothetical protein
LFAFGLDELVKESATGPRLLIFGVASAARTPNTSIPPIIRAATIPERASLTAGLNGTALVILSSFSSEFLDRTISFGAFVCCFKRVLLCRATRPSPRAKNRCAQRDWRRNGPDAERKEADAMLVSG